MVEQAHPFPLLPSFLLQFILFCRKYRPKTGPRMDGAAILHIVRMMLTRH